jgi:hypothetical protein
MRKRPALEPGVGSAIGNHAEQIVRRKINQKPLWIMLATVVLMARIALLLNGGDDSSAVHADFGITTQTAAAAAGAGVLPTDPKLSIEPK